MPGDGIVGVLENQIARDVVNRKKPPGVVVGVLNAFASRIDDGGSPARQIVFVAQRQIVAVPQDVVLGIDDVGQAVEVVILVYFERLRMLLFCTEKKERSYPFKV